MGRTTHKVGLWLAAKMDVALQVERVELGDEEEVDRDGAEEAVGVQGEDIEAAEVGGRAGLVALDR